MSHVGVLMAGTHSGAGKTTVTLAVLAALMKKGIRVQPFKVGPDYLDPSFHEMAAGRISRNLDGWMMGHREVLKTFREAAADTDFSVIEGVMGLYDGLRGRSEEGSSAQIAKWLSLPVVLVVEAKGLARTAGALVLGLLQFDPQVKIEAVIFNRISSPHHLEILRESVESTCKIPVLGGIPSDPAVSIPSRHLGLVHAKECFSSSLNSKLADLAEKYLDLDRLLDMGGFLKIPLQNTAKSRLWASPKCRIAIAKDEAFFFYYQDNLDLLKRAGAELLFFSPLHDTRIPEADSLYFGGGYPENHAGLLSGNRPMIESVIRFARKQGPVYAECGGLMYLSEGIETLDGIFHPLAGILPGRVKMGAKLKGLGYRETLAQSDNLLFRQGEKARGHEFHYSEWISTLESEKSTEWKRAYQLYRGGETVPFKEEGLGNGNILASYVHLHFGSDPAIADRWVAAGENFRHRQT